MKIFYISFEGVETFPHCLSKTLEIKCRRVKIVHIKRETSVALRGGLKFLSCDPEFAHPPTAEL